MVETTVHADETHRAEAVANWNTRPTPTSAGDVREAIARIIAEKAAGEDFDAFGPYWIETPFAEAADAILALTSTPTPDQSALREAVKKLLPIGNDNLPGDRVVPIYVRMDELRALHALVALGDQP